MRTKSLIALLIVFSVGFTQVAYAVDQNQKVFFFKTNTMGKYGGELNMEIETRKTENVVIENNVLSVGTKDNYVFFGTSAGVSRLNLIDMSFDHYLLEDRNISQVIGVGNSEYNTVWVGRAGGISKIQDKKIEELGGTSFENIFVHDMFTDKDGNVWMATNKDLHRFNTRDQWRTYKYERGQIPSSFMSSFFIDSKENMWIGADAIYRLEKGKSIKKINWEIYSVADNMQFRLNDIAEVDGWIYFATDRGVFRRRLNVNTWEHFADDSILPSDYATSLAVASDGTLWIGTRSGLVSYKNGAFFVYTTNNGLIDNYVNTVTADGNGIWIGTRMGAARLKDNKWITVTRDGVNDADFTLTVEQEQFQVSLEKKENMEKEREERRKQAEIWATRKGVFEDLKDTESWAADYVFELYEDDIFKENEKFFPLRNVTREELAKMVAIAADMNPDKFEAKLAPFIDVPEEHWANKYIYALSEVGVLEKGKVFGLGEQITRLEAIKWILKAFDVKLTEHDEPKFLDVEAGDKAWVETADVYDIAKGYNKATSSKAVARDIYSLPRFLKPGSSGKDVESLQKILQSLGFYPENRGINGIFDGVTTDAVADYQVARGILPKFTNGKFTSGLGAAGGATRSKMISEEVSTGNIDSEEWFFDPDGKLTRAQMAKVLLQARKVLKAKD